MNKEEILEKSRRENGQKDPYEMEINLKASQIGTMCALILCFVLFVVQILAGGGMNYGLWGVIMAACGAANLYAGIRLKNKNRIALGICYLLLGLLAAAVSICNMF
ncbi:DUF6442 family protein [Huintestinicola sp.]|uniref:DUF6442 family protein n=1 Tax=Huintestinicola sp. TaxID=2981661 RepID=UPI003D7CA62E